MSDPCQSLQSVYSDILKDMMSMSADVIKKSDRHLKEVESLDIISVDTVTNHIRTLFERVNTNVSLFTNKFETACTEYKNSREIENSKAVISPKKNSRLSLKKNGETRETEVDLTNSDDEEVKAPPSTKKEEIEEASTKENEPTAIQNGTKETGTDGKENGTDGSVSDTDSERTVHNFDAPVTSNSADECDETIDDFVKVLDELDKITNDSKEDEQKKVKPLEHVESMSFDFDDTDDELTTHVGKSGGSQDTQQIQKDNHELLDMLTKAVDDTGENITNEEEADEVKAVDTGENITTEEEADEVLKRLEDEISLPSDTDSDKSMSEDEDSSEDYRPPMVYKKDDSETEGSLSDTESMAEDKQPEYELKDFDINLKKRVDQMSDTEIDRLCDINNINKRKCVKVLGKLRKRKRRRIRVLSSSSSSSCSSLSGDLSSNGSTTPDLVIDMDRPPSSQSVDFPDVTALADEFADKLDKEEDEDMEVSSDSSEEEVKKDDGKKEEATVKPAAEVEEIKTEEVVDVDEEDAKKPEKKVGTWRYDGSLWSSSDEDSNDNEPLLADPLEDKKEGEDEDEKKEIQVVIEDDETTVISDSTDSTDSSDDCICLDTSSNDDGAGGKGRRNIRPILADDELNELTQRAKSEEDERILRLAEHSKTMESIQSQHEEFVLDFDVKSGAPLITVHYNLARMLKPHQRDGVHFMWEACYESVEILKKNPGTGCILAHCMGLGKTLQVIALIHTLFTHPVTKTKHVLVTCPLSTVINWRNEFKKTATHSNEQMPFQVHYIIKGDVNEKIQIVHTWRQNGGVLVMGYETFQILTNDKLSSRVSPEVKQKATVALIDPGPDLVICDEGHQLKNGKTLRTQALMKVNTKRRIVLTGTPLQNNLQEYYYMVQFVKPHLLGTFHEYDNRFAAPIKNGQYHDSQPKDIKLMKQRTHVLTKLLKRTIHRVESGVLTSYLPEITDYTVFIKLTPLQRELYITYIHMVTSQLKNFSKVFFHDAMLLNFSHLHPYTLQLYYSKPRPKKKKKKRTEDVLNDDEQDAEDISSHVPRDWYQPLFPADVSTNVNYSAKLKVILDIIDETVLAGEKALIFGKFLVELDILEHFLTICGTKNFQSWRPCVDYLRMDGETSIENRDKLCKYFNTNPTAKVFLLTHKVGGLGLNLTGANRVIMIGSNHNPSLDTQSMYRVYRFGQEKRCYVYRLLSLGTMEEKIYHRCVVKLHLSGTVIDKLHFKRHYRSNDHQEMYEIEFGEYEKDRPIPVVPTDKLLALLLQNTADIYKYYPHNSLLENRPEEELTDEDKKLAWDEFNHHLKEEAAKLAAVSVLPPPQNPVMRLPIFPANLTYPYNRFGQMCTTRTNAPTLVPNPMNNNARGFMPRGFPNGNIPQNMNRLPPPAHSSYQNSVLPFVMPQNGGVNRAVVTPSPREALEEWNRLKNSHYAQQRLQNFAQALTNRTRDSPANEAPPAGEFNYALNKVV